MPYATPLVVAVFCLVYLGMALGRWPGLKVDRSGIAILGAIVLYLAEAVTPQQVLDAIDWPAILVLFGLMILSAQFAACGFYDLCSARIAGTRAHPAAILALTVAVAGVLSAILANDVVVFAMTPMLIRGLLARGLDPRPFLIGLAGGANAGSAATVIGNPQNILIGQSGNLGFWDFARVCAPPAILALATVFLVVWFVWRRRFESGLMRDGAEEGALAAPQVHWIGIGKAILATAALLALFATSLPHVASVLVVAAVLLISRRLATREILGLVDWHLLALFAGLFVVTAALAATGLPAQMLAAVRDAGIDPAGLPALVPLTLAGSNSIGNVPTVILLLAVFGALPAETLFRLAVFSTLAGNLLIVGSLANIIVVERARHAGVKLRFAEHARCGVPMTLLSFVLAILWFAVC